MPCGWIIGVELAVCGTHDLYFNGIREIRDILDFRFRFSKSPKGNDEIHKKKCVDVLLAMNIILSTIY